MLNLFIDTSQNFCNLALFKNKKIIDCVSIPTNKNMTDIVIEKISNLLSKNNFANDDISNIYLVIGPGSFTGIRVGIVIAKSWMIIKKIKIFCINSLLLQTSNGISIINAKSNKSYLAIYKKGKELLKPQIINNERIDEKICNYKNKFNIFIDFKNINIFNNLISSINYFTEVKNVASIKGIYLKKPV